MEESPSPNIHSQVHRAALRQSHGLADGKQPGAERQSYPCCCPKGFLCSTGLLFKLMFCLALKSSFAKAGDVWQLRAAVQVGQQGVVDKDAFLGAADVLI